MEFTTVNPDDDVDEMGESELREVVSEFEDAQERNLSEFKSAQEALNEFEEFDVSIEEAQEFKADTVEEVAEHSPLAEDELSDFGLSRLRELRAEFSEETEEVEEDEVEDDEGEFSDMGTKGETDPEGDGENFSELQKMVSNVSGLEFTDE